MKKIFECGFLNGITWVLFVMLSIIGGAELVLSIYALSYGTYIALVITGFVTGFASLVIGAIEAVFMYLEARYEL